MIGRHRMPQADGVTAGTGLLGAVAVGLGLVVSMVFDEVHTDSVPNTYSVPAKAPHVAALATPERPPCRCAQRSLKREGDRNGRPPYPLGRMAQLPPRPGHNARSHQLPRLSPSRRPEAPGGGCHCRIT